MMPLIFEDEGGVFIHRCWTSLDIYSIEKKYSVGQWFHLMIQGWNVWQPPGWFIFLKVSLLSQFLTDFHNFCTIPQKTTYTFIKCRLPHIYWLEMRYFLTRVATLVKSASIMPQVVGACSSPNSTRFLEYTALTD